MTLLLLFGGQGVEIVYTPALEWQIDSPVSTWLVGPVETWTLDIVEPWSIPSEKEAKMAKTREILQGLQTWGEDENYAPAVDVSNVTGAISPTSPVVTIWLKNDDGTFTDKTSTNLTGSPAVNGTIITLPAIHSLVNGSRYRVEIKFTFGGGIYERYAEIKCER